MSASLQQHVAALKVEVHNLLWKGVKVVQCLRYLYRYLAAPAAMALESELASLRRRRLFWISRCCHIGALATRLSGITPSLTSAGSRLNIDRCMLQKGLQRICCSQH